MALRLVDDDYDISLEIPLATYYREAVQIQMQRCVESTDPLPFEVRLVASITELVDTDLQPPTASQMSYAISIARALHISIPGEALRFKGTMHEFIARHAPTYRHRAAAGLDSPEYERDEKRNSYRPPK